MGGRGYPQGFTKGYEIYCTHNTGTTFRVLILLSLTKFIELHAPTHITGRAANCTVYSYGYTKHSMYTGILCTITCTVHLCCRSSDGMVQATQFLEQKIHLLPSHTPHTLPKGRGMPGVAPLLPLPLPSPTPRPYPQGFPYPCHSLLARQHAFLGMCTCLGLYVLHLFY
jgi:hypothetical protein